MAANGNEWPMYLADQVAELWEHTKLTATEIGMRIGKTRNAVLGKIGRMGLLGTTARVPCSHGESAARRKRKYPAVRRPRRSVVVLPLPLDVAAPPPPSVPFIETAHNQCRYMPGDDRMCCGQPTWARSSWCPHHYRMVYQVKRNAS
jgi:hypothetical protein